MENQNSTSTTPNLSQYFADDPPSFFDQITEKSSINSQITAVNFDGKFNIPEYLDNPEPEDDLKVNDDIRNMWEQPYSEPGIPPLLTTPGVLSPTDLTDPIRDAVQQYLGDEDLSQRKVMTVDDVTQDERGLRALIAAGCFRSAVNLTGRLLTIYGQGYGRAGQPAKHSPHSLQLWFTRLALLTKLGQYDLLQSESEPFGLLNNPDVYYEFYPEMYAGKKGSIASFSFRLLLAEIPLYTGQPIFTMNRLSDILNICNDIQAFYKDDKQAYAFWHRRKIRVLHSMINCAIMMKDYCMVDDIMSVLLTSSSVELNREDKRALFSAWGRIYLQIGDVFGAEQKFSEARRLREMNSAPDLRDLVDKGLIAVAQNDFQEAHTNFQKALQYDNGNTMLLNNMGVCLLYCGKLKNAIHLFERAINENPQKALNESLLLNLSTLYELESSNSKVKKLNLLRLVSRFKPDLNISLDYCLKLQSGN